MMNQAATSQKRQGIGLPANRDWPESGAGEGDYLAMVTEISKNW